MKKLRKYIVRFNRLKKCELEKLLINILSYWIIKKHMLNIIMILNNIILIITIFSSIEVYNCEVNEMTKCQKRNRIKTVHRNPTMNLIPHIG